MLYSSFKIYQYICSLELRGYESKLNEKRILRVFHYKNQTNA